MIRFKKLFFVIFLFNTPIPTDTLLIKNIAGAYINNESNRQLLEVEDNDLFYVINPDFKLPLFQIAAHEFILEGAKPDVILTFTQNKEGNIANYTLSQPETGEESKWMKLNSNSANN